MRSNGESSFSMVMSNKYNRSSVGREFELQRKLHVVKKQGRTFSDYVREYTSICDQLSSIGKPVEVSIKICGFLIGLGRDYDPISAVIQNSMSRLPPPTFPDVLYEIEAFDNLLQTYDATIVSSQMAFNVQPEPAVAHEVFQNSYTNFRGRGSYNSRPDFNRGRGGYSSRGRGFYQQTVTSGPKPPSSVPHTRPTCQICGRNGHTALHCWNRFDNNCQSPVAPNAFAAFQVSDSSGAEWIPDSGATTHVTSNVDVLNEVTPYTGPESIMVADDNYLPITHWFCASITQSRFRVHTPQQNGIAERKHRHLIELSLSMLFQSQVPLRYWVESFSTANYITNLLPSTTVGFKTPYEILLNHRPEYTSLRVFGSACYPCLRPYTDHKFEPRSLQSVFLGYQPNSKGYRCLYPPTGRVYVSMHDVVREMALWITSDFEKRKDRCIVQPNAGLHELPKVKNWKVVEKNSLMDNEIEEMVSSHECPQLTTLFLQRNFQLVNISGEFFWAMPRLLVLDLSWNLNLYELPEEISELVSLRYLNLSFINIEQLPLGLQALKMLIHLNLAYVRKLESVSGISNLSSLRKIRLIHSKTKLDINLMKELELLEHLEFVSINVSLSMIGEQWLYDSKARRCIREIFIAQCTEEAVRILVLPIMVDLRYIRIESRSISEIKIDLTLWNKRFSSPSFSNVTRVDIKDCNGLTDLTWLLSASNLIHLYVGFSTQLEVIISKEKAASFLDKEEKETCIMSPFQKLEFLDLQCLPELKSIHWTSPPFPCLKEIKIINCRNLRKLPLNSQSVANVEEFVIHYGEEEWKEKIEWEDEATKLRFLPSLRAE